MRARGRYTLLVGAVIAVTLVLSSCGSTKSDDTGPAESDAEVAAAVKEAERTVATYTAEQDPIEVAPLTQPAPAGARVAILTCIVPTCAAGTDPAAEAAEHVGWTVMQQQCQLTPEAYTACWNTALQQDPDVIIYVSFFPAALVKDQIAEAKSREIPLVAITYNDASFADSQADAASSGSPELAQSGELMGSVITADAGGPTDVVFVWDPTLKNTLTPLKEGLEKVTDAAGITVQTLDISISDVGSAVPSQVVNYLQRHPEVKYIAMCEADFGAGLPQALKAAGLADKVKIVSRVPHAADLSQIKDGEQFASVAEEVGAAGYRAVDHAIRLLTTGQTVDNDHPGWHQIMVADSITDTSSEPQTPGVPDAFYDAWNVG